MNIHKFHDIYRKGLYRTRSPIVKAANSCISIGNRKVLNFTGNDYFEISQSSLVKEAVSNSVAKNGFGSGASALVSGYHYEHKKLEDEFSEYIDCEASILFNTGYQANLAVMQCFAGKGVTVIADKYIHASIIDGIKLSGGKLRRYKHLSVDHAEYWLNCINTKDKILITESIFSMEGSIAHLDILADLSETYNSEFIIDNAHGLGILEHRTRAFALAKLIISPLGKSMGGFGAMVSGSYEDIQVLVQHARSYRFTTAMPPAIASGLLAALSVLKNNSEKYDILMSNISYFNGMCDQYDIQLINKELTPIRCILIKDNKKLLQLQEQILIKGYHISCIRPNTVPAGMSRLRITLTSSHTKTQILGLIRELKELL